MSGTKDCNENETSKNLENYNDSGEDSKIDDLPPKNDATIQNKFPCEICHKRFKKESYLREHTGIN